MEEVFAWNKKRKGIAQEVIKVLHGHELSVKEATEVLEIAKIAIDSYSMVQLIPEKKETPAGTEVSKYVEEAWKIAGPGREFLSYNL